MQAETDKAPHSDEPTRQSSSQESSVIIWERRDDLYPSLTSICTYAPSQFIITVRHTSGAEKSVSFEQAPGRPYTVSAEDRRKFFEVALLLTNQLASKLGLPPVET